MNRIKHLLEYLFEKDGIAQIFNNIKWLSISSVIIGLSILIWEEGNLALTIASFIFSFFLVALSIAHGLSKIIIPIFKEMYETEFRLVLLFGFKEGLKSIAYWLYLWISLIYLILFNEWLKLLVKNVIR